jgi:very-short-patch-repair endonuclease
MQARRAGLTEKAIELRLASGRWIRVLPEVFLLAGGKMDDRAWMMAAYLWAGDGSAVSHTSAAALWGLNGFSEREPYHLTTRSKEHTPHKRIRLHSCFDLSQLEIEVIDSVGVTSVGKTLIDLAAFGHPRFESAFDQCLRQRLVSIDQMWLMIDRPSSFRRRGVRRLRNVLTQRDPQSAPTQSEMEDLFIRMVRSSDIPEPIPQFPVELRNETIHIDFAYPGVRLGIECDGYAWHMDRDAFERDRYRDAELQLLGWRILRLTWAQLRFRPYEVLALLRRHLTGEVAINPL